MKVRIMFCRDNFILTVRVKAKSGHENELRVILEKGVRDCSGQEGLVIYNLHQDKDDPALFMLYGHFSPRHPTGCIWTVNRYAKLMMQ